MSVGVMKDYKLELRNLRASHTLQRPLSMFETGQTGDAVAVLATLQAGDLGVKSPGRETSP